MQSEAPNTCTQYTSLKILATGLRLTIRECKFLTHFPNFQVIIKI